MALYEQKQAKPLLPKTVGLRALSQVPLHTEDTNASEEELLQPFAWEDVSVKTGLGHYRPNMDLCPNSCTLNFRKFYMST